MNRSLIRKIGGYLCAVIIFLTCSLAFGGCIDELEWWEDLDNVVVVYEEEVHLATPHRIEEKLGRSHNNERPAEIRFTYVNDGERHIPSVKVFYKGEEKAYGRVYSEEYFNPRTEQWEGSAVNGIGEYRVRYDVYRATDIKFRSYHVYITRIKN